MQKLATHNMHSSFATSETRTTWTCANLRWNSLSIAEKEYEGVQDALVTEDQLVGFFIDGRYSDRLKLQVMRDNPPNMQNAINSARGDFSCDQEKLILLLSVMSGNQWKVYRFKRVAKRDDWWQRQRQRRDMKCMPQKLSVVETTKSRTNVVCWTCNKR